MFVLWTGLKMMGSDKIKFMTGPREYIHIFSPRWPASAKTLFPLSNVLRVSKKLNFNIFYRIWAKDPPQSWIRPLFPLRLSYDKLDENALAIQVFFFIFFSDVTYAEIFQHHETHASRLRDGRFDFGHGFHCKKFPGPDDATVCRSSNYTISFVNILQNIILLYLLSVCFYFPSSFQKVRFTPRELARTVRFDGRAIFFGHRYFVAARRTQGHLRIGAGHRWTERAVQGHDGRR